VSSLAGRSKQKKLAYNYYEKWLIYILANHLSGRKKIVTGSASAAARRVEKKSAAAARTKWWLRSATGAEL